MLFLRARKHIKRLVRQWSRRSLSPAAAGRWCLSLSIYAADSEGVHSFTPLPLVSALLGVTPRCLVSLLLAFRYKIHQELVELVSSLDNSDMHQEAMNTHSLEEALGSPNPELQQEKKLKPLPDQALKCPRCDSTNTKFCYYNNYSLSQPRYFCKGCRRYWTQGGSLRNVPVGGGCRKNKRSSTTSSSSSSTTSRRTQEQTHTTSTSPMLPSLQNPVLPYDRNDLTLAFARLQKSPTGSAQYDSLFAGNPNPVPATHNTGPGFLDILRSGGFFDTRGTGGFHNLYYGFGVGGIVDEESTTVLPVGEVDGGAAATIIQESCKNFDGDGRAMAGMQYWQMGEDGNMGLESGRDYLGGVGPVSSSVWHGLVNSPLI